jgi:hypothetical protein
MIPVAVKVELFMVLRYHAIHIQTQGLPCILTVLGSYPGCTESVYSVCSYYEQ